MGQPAEKDPNSFFSKRFSVQLNRTLIYVTENPGRSFVAFSGMCSVMYLYESFVAKRKTMPSHVTPHLEYEIVEQTYKNPLSKPTKTGFEHPDADDRFNAAASRSYRGGVVDQATIKVSKNQLEQRQEFWKVRAMERNWSIMSQDRQKQIDDPWYRKERASDDDYLRHSSNGERQKV